MSGSAQAVIPLLLALGAVALWWAAALAARDRAIDAARRLCRREGWQLLDQTVAMERFRPVRSERGVAGDRRYRFEFSTDGGQRRAGGVRLVGGRVERVWADAPDGRLIESTSGPSGPDPG